MRSSGVRLSGSDGSDNLATAVTCRSSLASSALSTVPLVTPSPVRTITVCV